MATPAGGGSLWTYFWYMYVCSMSACVLIYVEVHMVPGGRYVCAYVGRPQVDMGCLFFF